MVLPRQADIIPPSKIPFLISHLSESTHRGGPALCHSLMGRLPARPQGTSLSQHSSLAHACLNPSTLHPQRGGGLDHRRMEAGFQRTVQQRSISHHPT